MKKQFLLGLMAMVLPWTAWAQGQANPEPNTFSVTFTGTDAAAVEEGTFEYKGAVDVGVKVEYNSLVAGEVKPEDLTLGENGYAVSCTYKVNQDSQSLPISDFTTGIKDAGFYTLTVTGTGMYSGVTPIIAEFTIEKKGLDLDGLLAKAGAKIQYGASATTLNVADVVELTTNNGLIDNADNTDALKCLQVLKTTMTGNDIGDAAVVEIGVAEPNMSTNYKYVGGKKNLMVEVEARDLVLSLKEGIEASREYDGSAINVNNINDIVADLDIVEGDVVDVDYVITKDGATVNEIKGAGIYTITVSLDGNGAGHYNLTTDNVSYEVTRANITIEKAVDKLEKVYDGESVSDELLEESFDIDGIVNDEITISMKPSNASKDLKDAGSKVLIMPYVGNRMLLPAELGDNKKPTGNGLDNYTITYSPTNFEITKRTVKYYFAGGSKTYDNKTVETPAYTVVVLDKDETTGFVNDEDGFDAEPVAKFAFGEDVTEAKNAADYTLVEDEEEAEKVTYQNGSQNYTAEFVANPQLSEDAENVNVNVYKINKVELTIKALDKTVKYGSDLSDLTDYLKIEASRVQRAQTATTNPVPDANIERGELVTGQEMNGANGILAQLGESLIIAEGVTTETVGTKEEAIKFAVTSVTYPNYNITLQAGDLIVEGEPSITLDALAGESAEDEDEVEVEPAKTVKELVYAYNGQKVGVKIKNLKNNFIGNYTGTVEGDDKYDYEINQTISPEKWYTLVLPFDITVAELSRLFEYAIVNVPNTANSNPDEIYFKLTMQEIPANTLMAFKVAYEMNWAEIKDIDFGEKVIKAPVSEEGEYKWAEDNAGNKFIGVYEKTLIKEANDFFWSAKTGLSTPADLVYNAFHHEVEVYPLNGYVHFEEKPSTNARIFMEEADGTITAINAVTGETVNYKADGWYTVGGVKLEGEPTQKGIYINNGKKVVIK